MNSKQPLLSIIIPVYGTEKYIKKCLDTVLGQTYKNLEVICVNDCTKDGAGEIMEAYAKKDKRLKIIKHEKNKGLFQARITGVKEATGEYIAFIDSDDYISNDYYRPLVQRAEKDACDMVLGNFVEVDENGWKFYSNIPRNLPKAITCLEGEEIYDTFMSQHGALFYWHVMWNKVYRKSYWDKCMKHYKNMKDGLIMTEDIAFSCVSLFYAQKLALEDNDCYFYCRHAAASTSTSLPAEKIIKNLKDVIFVFGFFEKFLKEKNIYKKYEENFLKFKEKYFRIWCNSLMVANLTENADVVDTILKGFNQTELSFCTEYEFHLNSLNTTWDPRFNDLKTAIIDDKIKIVSFDIFDTLLKRPLWNPEDIFYFVQEKAKKFLIGTEENSFIKFRKNAEQRCRELNRVNNPLFEDVTLSEIYDTMSDIYGIPKETTDKLKQIEVEIEKKFLSPRNSGKSLFELAKFLGKKIAIVSDMYLEEKDIKDILKMNGYDGYDYFYLSSKNRKLKTTGNLFKAMLSDIKKDGYTAKDVIHFGDTWKNDVEVPRTFGMNSRFLPKAVSVFNGEHSDIFNGNCTDFIKLNFSNAIDSRAIMGQLPIRTMYAIVANEIFDNPFTPFQRDSKYNGDPYFMGYFALGTYILGMAQWIYRLAKKNKYDKILFLARDGFFVHKVFKELLKETKSKIKCEYVYATRKSTLPFVIDEPQLFYCADNFVNIYSPEYTFRKFLQLFEPVTNKLTPELEAEYSNNGIVLDEQIKNLKNFNSFIKVYLKLSFNKQKLEEQKKIVGGYFKNISTDHTAAFDIGYSGRIQKALSKLCGRPIDALFAHDNGFSTNVMAESENFNVYNFYDYSPLATDIVREVFVSESSPSCVGYKQEGNKVVPVFGADKNELMENFALDLMQIGAINFAKKYLQFFGEFIDYLPARNIESGYAFEHFCLHASEFDKFVFINHKLEDKVYSGFDDVGMVYRWNQNLNEINNGSYHDIITREVTREITKETPVYIGQTLTREEAVYQALLGRSRFKKAMYYMQFEPKLFWKRLFAKKEKKKKVK